MQGSLDNPPIVVRESRWKTGAAFVLFCAIATGSFLWQRQLPDGPFTKEWFLGEAGLLLFGFGGFLCALRLWRPHSITLAPDALTIETPYQLFGARYQRYAWFEVIQFRLWRHNWVWTYVLIDLRRDHPDLPPGEKPFIAHGRELSGGWDLPTAKVVDLLNQAHERWSRVHF